MRNKFISDVPSPIDLRQPEVARDWAKSASEIRPWRVEFFRAIVQELGQLNADGLSVLELGSGPGFLAQHILETHSSATYVALDFSPAMHALAQERLGALASRVSFVERDFKDPLWNVGLSTFDAVVSMQAVHELRHKRHAVPLYQAVRELLRSDGNFLMCDHFVGEEGMSNTNLYMSAGEHETALRAGGFSQVTLMLQKKSLLLFRAAR